MDYNSDLPKGWFKEEVIRKSGLSAGKTDIYYHGPDGRKYRSKPQIARELGGNCDLAAFDFKTGRMMNQSSMVRRAKAKKTAYDFSRGFRGETNLSLPIRQTASIFKQPVTVIRSHPDSLVRHDLKHGPPDSAQPRQLFWEKSLTGLQYSSIDEESLKSIVLPSKIKGIGPELSTENLLQSIAAALHLNNAAVVGQSQSTSKFAKDPTVHINTSQPLIQQVMITDDDIRQQETKVESSRRKLEELLAAVEKSNQVNLLKDDRPLSAVPSEGSSDGNSNPPPTTDAKVENKSRKRKASPTRSSDQAQDPEDVQPPAVKQSKELAEEPKELEEEEDAKELEEEEAKQPEEEEEAKEENGEVLSGANVSSRPPSGAEVDKEQTEQEATTPEQSKVQAEEMGPDTPNVPVGTEKEGATPDTPDDPVISKDNEPCTDIGAASGSVDNDGNTSMDTN